MKKVVLLDLFSGMGGFSKGFEDAGYEVVHLFSEVEKNAIANYLYNFKKSKYVGSVEFIRGTALGKVDVITFGSPCQDFSIAGQRKGLAGEKSSLIKEAIRVVTEVRPSVFIWENVKGAFSSNSRRDFWAILQAFANIGGYRLEWQLCNTSWLLPQNRERIFLVGRIAKPGRNFGDLFPIGEDDILSEQQNESKKRQSQTQISGTLRNGQLRADDTFVVTDKAKTLTAGANSGGLHSDMNVIKTVHYENRQQNRIYNIEEIMASLTSNRGDDKSKIIAQRKRGDGQEVEIKQENKTNTLTGVQKDNYLITQIPRGFNKGNTSEISGTLSASSFETNNYVNNIRRLTEIEFERLQGFPDDWTKYGMFFRKKIDRYLFKKSWLTPTAQSKLLIYAINNFELEQREIASTNRYKLCGNAVTATMVKVIAKKIKSNQ